jgi:adenylate kinase family enzyme
MDCIPLNYKVTTLARKFNLDYTGVDRINREEMFKRIANNDILVYVTFTECAPLIPLESLELGVPCITGDNHHYFEGTELEKYLVVKKEDNIIEIYNQIKYCLENKETVLQLYNNWKKEYDIKAKESIKEFVKV